MVSAFFYGTLMHPKILLTVIDNNGSHLRLTPAVLLNYTRHKVKNQVYPGIVPYKRGRELFIRELEQEERSVRGMLVTGLTEEDIECLDQFEGDEYERITVDLYPFGDLLEVSHYSIDDDKTYLPSKPPPLPSHADLPTSMQADTYVMVDIKRLEPELWSFEDFVRNNAWKWHGQEASRTNPDIAEIERGRTRSESAKLLSQKLEIGRQC
ncbi:hypothetical protein K435DRAFT_710241 [Dendrothele bispora CBS 962.96]|uniref:Putative gamma-glutamylcyclotransferase n=1 Tax=Dendrothele bispora (strain CBS 962.96) TaxID=1314807 RepID=A0A4S8MY33_DENBC|nr:hypothetical protein K435DRAFT_710241 [Dendrothele bispora CBS 962.96]